LIINVSYDSSVNGAPSGFTTAFAAAVQFLENTYVNPITVNIDVGFGEIGPDNTPLGSNALGESNTYFNNYTYSDVRSALVADTTSADQVSAGHSLPAADPTGTNNYWMATAEAKALGLMGPSGAVDGYIGFSSSLPFTYNDSNGVASGTYDFNGVALHELTEVLGRELFVGNDGIGSNSYTPLDLFHYSSNGMRDFSGTTAGYFSPDGGASHLDSFNTNPNGDFGDWASSAGNDAVLAFSNSGVVNKFSPADMREMNVLGYDEPPVLSAFVGDFDGDTKSDIVWLNDFTNTPTMWLMNGTVIANSAVLPTPPSSWTIVGTGDFYGDGTSDLLWQNSNGQPSIWEMNGASLAGSVVLPTPPSEWRIVGTGDFNGDGHSDILWTDTLTNTPAIWEMNGSSIVSFANLVTPPPQWKIVATGDFSGNGKSDILWINTVSNTPSIWEMNGTSLVSSAVLTTPPSSWRLVGTGDVNGDHTADILWQNSSSGDVAIWEMNGTSIVSMADVGSPGTSWQLVRAGDFIGNGKSDLLFLNPSNDQVQIWTMNGMQVVTKQTLATTAAQSGAQGNAQASATPLSSSPVLAGIDSYNAGGPLAAPVLGAAPSGGLGAGGLGASGPASDPLGTTRGLLTAV
jgi:hypothetical protein